MKGGEKMDKMKLDTKFEIIESNYLHPQFKKAKCYIAYYGKNKNKSNIPKSAFELAIPSLFNIPIVGEYIEQLEDFGDHGGKIEIKDNNIEYVQTTKPWGVVPETSKVEWELVTEKNGFQREYLTCEIILWYSRYPELEVALTNENWQSMEIDVVKGHREKDGYYFIEEFIFSALCILGKDVSPCFEESSIKFNLDKENFKSEFKLMLGELKEFDFNNSNDIDNTISQKGGNLMEDNIIAPVIEQQPVEEFATVITTTEDTIKVVTETIDQDSYKVEELKIEKTTIEVVDVQPIDNQPQDAMMTEDFAVEPVVEEIVEPIIEPTENFAEMYKELEGKFSQLEIQFNTLVEENNKLKEFKAVKENESLKMSIDEVTSQFALEESEIAELKTKAYAKEISVEEYQEKLFALVGKKNFSKIEKVVVEEPTTPLTFSLKSTETCPYPSLSQFFQ